MTVVATGQISTLKSVASFLSFKDSGEMPRTSRALTLVDRGAFFALKSRLLYFFYSFGLTSIVILHFRQQTITFSCIYLLNSLQLNLRAMEYLFLFFSHIPYLPAQFSGSFFTLSYKTKGESLYNRQSILADTALPIYGEYRKHILLGIPAFTAAVALVLIYVRYKLKTKSNKKQLYKYSGE